MSEIFEISNKEARQIAFLAQGYDCNNHILDIINRLGYVQIDTLSVTERAHHHVLHSRNKHYDKNSLDSLFEQKKVFEYWSHAAAILPMEHYRYSLIRKKSFKSGASHWFKKDKKMMQYVLDRIKAEGPLQSKDFKHTKEAKGEWYEWKPAKNALEQLFMEGTIMVKARNNFQKVYDLTERVLPDNIDVSEPSETEYLDHLIMTAIQLHGFAKVEEIGYLRKGIRQKLEKRIKELLEDKKIVILKVGDECYYTTHEQLNYLQQKVEKNIHILNPFDHLVIQRKRLKNIFDFDYQIECYVPEPKRKFGYYVLPVLYGDQFVGRLDAKADRKQQTLFVKNFWYESDYKPNAGFKKQFDQKLLQFARFCGCEKVVI